MNHTLINETTLKLALSLKKSYDCYVNSNIPETKADKLVNEFISEANQFNSWYTSEYAKKGLDLLIEDLLFVSDYKLPELPEPNGSIGFLYKAGRSFDGLAEIIYSALHGFSCEVQVPAEDQSIFVKYLELISDFPAISKRIRVADNLRSASSLISFVHLNDTMREYFAKFRLLELHNDGASLILTGKENDEQLEKIAESICLFFGRSTRNVKLLFVPNNYNINRLQPYFSKFSDQLYHNRYYNNYDYRKSVMIINRIPFIEYAPLLITEETGQSGYTSVVVFIRYARINEVVNNEFSVKYPIINIHKNESIHYNLSGFKSNFHKLNEFLAEITN
ncbi:MAG TPA: hypothetical protein VK212_06710 [Lentimicrobium sp.]|nr:hypothetical protein [Lentimicrobium sp.]